MTANELLELIRLGGYLITVSGNALNVSPSFSIDEEMACLIKLHKRDLIELLNKEHEAQAP